MKLDSVTVGRRPLRAARWARRAGFAYLLAFAALLALAWAIERLQP